MERRRLGRSDRVDLDDVIYGVHAVEEALAAGEPLRHLHIAQERKRDFAIRRIVEQAREQNVPVRFEPRAYFSRFPYKAHQAVVAFGEPFAYSTLEEVLRKRSAAARVFIVLDHITDPHNVGAIVRTAECAGATAAILPERRSAGINPTVRKAAAGASAYLPIARVANIADALRKMKKAGIWVAGADAGRDGIPPAEAGLGGDLAIVIGAEGKGLSEVARRQCDFLVRIPLFGKVASLNASVAAALLLYEAVRQRTASKGSPAR